MTISYRSITVEQIPSTATTAHTVGAVDSAHILSATVHNESAANVTLTANVVLSGGAVAVTNRYVNRIVPAGKSIVLHELINMLLNTGGLISVTAGTASALNLKMAIKEITA
jgi:hypothetical protein